MVLAAGVAARLWSLSHSAVEHFDEGVYASNIYFGAPEYAYPGRRFYAPPLLPALIEAGMIAGLPPNLAALLPSFLAGCGTIAALWWFGRSWFSPEAGLAAAALVALNDFHIALSTTALTDVLLGLWLVLAVDAISRSLVGGDFRWAVGAGIYTGLAWWTKYNGWLPLAIEAAAMPLLWFFLRPPANELRRWAGCFALTAFLAALVWSPYYFSLQSQGGYGPIAANHAKYIVGFASWFGSATRQLSNQFAFGIGFLAIGTLLALAVAARQQQKTWLGLVLGLSSGVGPVVAAIIVICLAVSTAGASIGLARLLVACHLAPKLDAAWRRRTTGLCLVAAWWFGMLFATPLYTPYPRLALPYLLAAWLATAINVAAFLPTVEKGFYDSPLGKFWKWVFLVALGTVLTTLAFFVRWQGLPSDRRGIERIAQQIHASEPTNQPRAIYVYGEPALFFQLRVLGEELVGPVPELTETAVTLKGKPIPTFLIAGPHAWRDPEFHRQLSAAKDRWELVNEFDYRPSAIVWLDLNDSRRSPEETANDDRVRLYRLRQ